MANLIDFSKEASFARMMNNLIEDESFENTTDSSVVAALLKAVAKENEYNALSAIASVQETSWDYAVNRSSLLASTKILTYVPHRKRGAVGTLEVSTGKDFLQANLYPKAIDIPFGSIFSSGDFNYTVVESYFIPANWEQTNDPFTIEVVQGTTETVTYNVPATEDYARIAIPGDFIEDKNIFVWVNGVKWEKKSSLRDDIESASKIFTVETLPNEAGIELLFGNEVFGKRLELNDTVKITYLRTDGSLGNVASSDIITKVSSTIYDVDGNEVALICRNPKALTGGKDYEDIDSIRRNAPSHQQTKESLTSIPEYQNFLNSEEFPLLDKVVVWGSSEINEDNNNAPGTYIASEANKIYIAGVSYEGLQATDIESTIRETLDTKKSPNALIQVSEIILIKVRFVVTAYVKDLTYTLKEVESNIVDKLSTTYALPEREFRQDINNSQYVAVVNSAAGLHHHITNLEYYIEKRLTGLANLLDIYMEDLIIDETKLYIKHDSHVDYTELAISSGGTQYVQNFVGVGDFVGLVSGTIDLRIGAGSFTLHEDALFYDPTEYTYKVEFKSQSTDAILTKRNQLLVYGESQIAPYYEGLY